jgi:hypothetical protein
VWEPGDGGPLMLLAGGSGIVPLRSILRHRRRTGLIPAGGIQDGPACRTSTQIKKREGISMSHEESMSMSDEPQEESMSMGQPDQESMSMGQPHEDSM